MKKEKKASPTQGGINFIRFLGFMLPMVAYLIVTVGLYPVNSGFIALGIVGCFILGLGLMNIVSLIDKMSLGWGVSAVTGLLGAGLVAVSCVMMYVPSIYGQLNGDHITFYFVIWTFLALSAVYYGFFRGAVNRYLQGKGWSKTRIKKAKKGLHNYWLYGQLGQQADMRWICRMNQVYVLLFPLTAAIQLLVGWWNGAYPITMSATILLLLLNVAMYYLVFSTWNCRKTEKKRSSKAEVAVGFLLPIAAVIALIRLFLGVVS